MSARGEARKKAVNMPMKEYRNPLSKPSTVDANRPTGRTAAEAIARAAIARVDPVRMITDALSLEGDRLIARVAAPAQPTAPGAATPPERTTPAQPRRSGSGSPTSGAAESARIEFDLGAFDRIVVVGAGKAGAPMAAGVEAVLGERIADGLVAVKHGHTATPEGTPLRRVRLIEAGHPVPDAASERAAREIADLVGGADERTLVIAVISGGGSALVTLPADTAPLDPERAAGASRTALSLEDIQQTTQLLLGAGTPIGDINCVRKHLSGIAGGHFCRIAAPATVLALILSDVVGDRLDSIASGLTAPDPTTFADAWAICERDGIVEGLPAAVRDLLAAGVAGDVAETPKPGDPAFSRVHPVLVGTNALALDAARGHADELGYHTLVLTSRLVGEAREVAHLFSGIAAEIVARGVPLGRPACVLAGGETTVTLRGGGKGGRNQEMALAVLEDIAQDPAAYSGVTFLSAGTDGNDGPTDAAGAWASPELAERSSGAGVAPTRAAALATNDAYHHFDAIEGLLRTGPTNTNVCDVQVLLVE
jgi:glycerate 2-kinase